MGRAVRPDAQDPRQGRPLTAATHHRRLAVPAGLVDSGLSSLSSFIMGLVAARELSPSSLGAFALCYSAFMLACTLPVSLLFTPVEARMLVLDHEHRPRILKRTLRIGPLATTLAGMAICCGTLLIPSSAPWSARVAFALTASALVAVSPVQDHVRRVMHASGRSWDAAKMSGVLVVTTAVLIDLGISFDIPTVWIPFTALAIGNVISLLFAVLALGVRGDRQPHGLDLSVRTLTRTGRWLLVGTGWGFLCGFVSVAVLTAIAGAPAAGYAEAARVLSQPVTVLAIGLLSVFNPDIMAAVGRGDGGHVWRRILLFFGLITVATVGWLLVTAVHWPGNPLPHNFPAAYHETGLLALLTVEQALGYAALVYGSALLAGGRERYQAGISIISGAIVVITVTATAFTGAYAIGLGGLAGAVVLHVGGVLGLWHLLAPKRVVNATRSLVGRKQVSKTADRERSTPGAR